MSDFRSSASFGKRIEYVVIGELLRQGYDIYQTLVDDQGIDCVLRHKGKSSLIYLDIQIKARSKKSKLIHAGRFSKLQVDSERPPRPNYLFIFYSEHISDGTYWIIPSTEIVKEGTSHGEKHKGKYNLSLAGIRKGSPYPKPRFEKYRDEKGFGLLESIVDELDTSHQGMTF